MHNTVPIIVFGFVAVLVLVLLFWTKPYNPVRSHYIHPALDGRPEAPVYYYQNLGPSLRVENQYHTCVARECGSHYDDYECLQRCYIKTMKNGSHDIMDRVCEKYKDDEKRYYSCLDASYGNYLWMDRETGVGSCPCGNGHVGPHMPDGSCSCLPKIPLKDRRMRNEFGQVDNFPNADDYTAY